MFKPTLKHISMATSAAALFALAGCANETTTTTADAGSAMIHCTGVNACKGHSDCKTANNSCAGHNACKGQGFVTLSPSVCEQVGGKAG